MSSATELTTVSDQLKIYEASHVRIWNAVFFPHGERIGNASSQIQAATNDQGSVEVYSVQSLEDTSAADILSQLQGKGKPIGHVTWNITPITPVATATALKSQLSEMGYSSRPTYWMALDLKKSPSKIHPSKEISRVTEINSTDAPGIHKMYNALTLAFGIGGVDSPWVASAVHGVTTELTDSRNFAIVEGDNVAAAASVICRDGHAWLYAVGVLEEYRRKGYAAAVCQKCIDAASENGADTIGLLVENPIAKDLYTKLGFIVLEGGFLYSK